MTKRERESFNPKYTKRIVILQKVDKRGRSKFYILHKKDFWSGLSIEDVPKYSRIRYSFDAAEQTAFKLIKNYEKIFLS